MRPEMENRAGETTGAAPEPQSYHYSTTTYSDESTAYPGQVRLRRAASYLLPGGDPWTAGPATPRGLAEAIEHILDAGFMPVADAGLMRAAWIDADHAGKQAIEAAARAQVMV